MTITLYVSYNEIYKDLYLSRYLFFDKTTGEREAYQTKDYTSDKMSVHLIHATFSKISIYKTMCIAEKLKKL